MTLSVRPFPRERAHTYAFLEDARRTCHVHLMTDIDATRIKAARAASGGKTSFVSYVVKVAADAVAACPEARESLRDGLRPCLATIPDVNVKVLFDKTIGAQRCVVSGTVTSAPSRSLEDIQQAIDEYKRAEVTKAGPFAALWTLQRLPLPLLRFAYRSVLRDPTRRAALQGAFSVTSVGQEPVRAIFPMIAGTLGFGVGRIADAPMARDGEVVVAPMFTLSLAFDHRVLDGALASELLGNVKRGLETWGEA
ncbi:MULTISPECIES: 2-oxo acid dehydrogenase subunit E2 [Methylosinus]|uniref:Dehydrogenase n=1 Tax=Methylosinus trichosporium (strain ATCC 35070 / NCIMB 11131 / UNIQEM 75 / OB3b) TaxID=595536 RepID=A0A2D2D7M5_METT3|nr:MULTISPECIES: 2-oxo acid dehydrogenase subunit E2 [Methylosinus]ATQ70964.1 dehydrogenase [Methylosinus trichosporium OB3b]OBS54396.1 dehydrogenase [Methylosinus sp. 3S-1]